MKLIVGLGNPGSQYDGTPHNVGFAALELLAREINAAPWSQKFKGLFCKGLHQGQGYVLLKPQTYMNLSGESVRPALDFFRLEAEDLLVISDDLDLPAGSLRYRKGGGHGGHNGLRSIMAHVAEGSFHRLKIGIGRPKGGKDAAGHVLSKASGDFALTLEESIQACLPPLLDFLLGKQVQIAGPPKAKKKTPQPEEPGAEPAKELS